MKTRNGKRIYPRWVCWDCGAANSRVTRDAVPTWQKGTCGVCERSTGVTQPRDFAYPRFHGFEQPR